MKKIIVFLVCVCFVTPVSAEPTCNGGILITSHKATDEGCSATTCNGHEFCRSNYYLNWWSAFAWCDSQGRKLADLSVMCPGVSQAPANTEDNCPNLKGLDTAWVWSSLAGATTASAVCIKMSSGAIFEDGRDHVYMRALCE